MRTRQWPAINSLSGRGLLSLVFQLKRGGSRKRRHVRLGWEAIEAYVYVSVTCCLLFDVRAAHKISFEILRHVRNIEATGAQTPVFS
jgi:hypothetical protein